MPVQTCPICTKQFFVSNYIASKLYCGEACKRRAKAQRKKGTDANVMFDKSGFFEVQHHPSATQLNEVAEYMLKGGTDLPSVYSGVMVKWVPPPGIIWKVEEDGRGYLAKAQKSLIEQIVEAQARGQTVEVKFVEPTAAVPALQGPSGDGLAPLNKFLRPRTEEPTVAELTPAEILALEEAKAQRAMEE